MGAQTVVRLGQAFSISWLVLLVPTTLDLVSRPRDAAYVAIVLATVLVFSAVYVWMWLRVVWSTRSVPASLMSWAILTGLGAFLAFLPAPPRYYYAFIYAAVVSGAALPLRLAVPTIFVDFVLMTVSYLALGSPLAAALSTSAMAPLFGSGAAATAMVIRSNAELRFARGEIARLAVHEERLRFARDLHDLLGHTLSLIALKSELAGRVLPADPEHAAREIREVERVARDALREVREAVAGYRQPTLALEIAGARAALDAAGIAYDIEHAVGALPAHVEAVLAWTVREGVTNVIRHSRARRCGIRVERADDGVRLEIVDDGRGEQTLVHGTGLQGLTERVASTGGVLEAGPVHGGGFRLSVSFRTRSAEAAT